MKQRFLKVSVFIFSIYFNLQDGFGQKSALDSSVYNTWPHIDESQISNDGKYVMYKITKGVNWPRQLIKLVTASVDRKWVKDFEIVKDVFGTSSFSPDSRYAIIALPNDSLQLLQLGTEKSLFLSNVQTYSCAGEHWMGYLQAKGNESCFVLYDFATSKKHFLPGITDFRFTEDEKKIILQKKNGKNKDAGTVLQIMDVNHPGAVQTLWQGKDLGATKYDTMHRLIAFETGNETEKAFWYCDLNEKKAATKLFSSSDLEDPSIVLGNIDKFSIDGDRLFLSLKEKLPEKLADPAALNVWNYNDNEVQNSPVSQFGGNQYAKTYNAVIFIKDRRFVQLLKKNEFPFTIQWQHGKNNDDWGLVDIYFPASGIVEKRNCYLVFTKDGSCKELPQQLSPFYISPNEKYLVYFDKKNNDFFSYEINTDKVRDISQAYFKNWRYYEPGYSVGSEPSGSYRISGWLNDSTAIIYSNYDIWLLDITGKAEPVCLTNEYGEKNHIRFTFLIDNNHLFSLKTGKYILKAFNVDTKDNGFYRINLPSSNRDPELLTMGHYIYDVSDDASFYEGVGHPVVKAKSKDVYLVRRQCAHEYPNLYTTRDFKYFQKVTSLHPEKDFNWYATELHHWTNSDGISSQGVLYKPENFDSHRKYPVIFYYYTSLSNNLNSYLFPTPSDGALNIPWYVSNGYLVFTPDIHHAGGVYKQYEESLQSIVSAAKYISGLPYIDTTKMGIQGLSWGGTLTNYFVTKTRLFAAACSSSGLGDFFSQSNGADHGQFSQLRYEGDNHSFNNIGPGKSIWQDTEWYLRNSPVMNAPNVATPLLIMETTNDGACPFVNAFEFYNALRRLGKKVWMLEYTDGDHGVYGKSSRDFDVRMQQFFGHFLKGEPAPVWMTKGIPVRMKGRITGLDYDVSCQKQ